jgi:hypothetical protein
MVSVMAVSSPSLVMMGDGSLVNVKKQLLSLHILCDDPESTTHTVVGDNVRQCEWRHLGVKSDVNPLSRSCAPPMIRLPRTGLLSY